MKRDLKALQRRRPWAVRLLAKDLFQEEVARQVGVSRQWVSAGAAKLEADRQAALKAKPLGRLGRLIAAEWRELVRLLKRAR